MRRTHIPMVLLFTMLLATIAAVIVAATGGAIKGRLVNDATGDPVIGATVVIVGSTRGATTDTDGRFEILRVEPGTYTLKISHLEYNTVEVVNVIVNADSTWTVNLKLSKKKTDLGVTITVKGTRDILDRFMTNSTTTIRAESIKHQPVMSVGDLLQKVAPSGTTIDGEVFIRGGRAGEVSYIVDGVPINEPYSATVGSNTLHTSPWPPVNGGTAIVNGRPFEAMLFEHYGVNPFVDTEDDHFSTFAADVDDASYVMTRSHLGRGVLPPKDAVRVEEFVNHFNYEYASPQSEAFKVYFEAAPSPFGSPSSYLLRIGIKGRHIAPEHRKDANLVFVIDVSGSMACESRLGLVKRALHMLVDELRDNDRVGIVIYGSTGQVHMDPRSLHERKEILAKIDELESEGSTNADQGLQLGYEMANKMFDTRKTNRIILCSDGVANVGTTRAEDLLKKYQEYIDKGITLTTVGFGMGNYNDILMEKMGDKGNGHYAYVDDIDAAKRVFVDNLTGTLEVIARDVKLQLDFNPKIVRSYRLLGYENRDVADEDFRDDTVDGGEIGSGHCTTALYEIKFHAQAPEGVLGTLSVRYKEPVTREVAEKAFPIPPVIFTDTLESTSADFRLAAAAAEFAEVLRESYWARDVGLDGIRKVADAVYQQNKSDDVLEFIGMIADAKKYKEALSQK